jgi:guanine deaminase
MHNHETFMKKAIELSQHGMRRNQGGPFGACVVKDGIIIGIGQNEVTSTCDPTAHAEIVAIRNACKKIKNFSLAGASIYTSCEPCPMCLAAIYWARIGTIFFANTRQDAASIGFDDDFIYREIPLPHDLRAIPISQLLQEEAILIFNEWRTKVDKIDY